MYNTIPSLEDQTVEKFLTNFRTLLLSKDLLDYKGDTVITNYQRAKRRYTAQELKEQQEKYDSGKYQDILLKHGTNILVPDDQIMREVIGTTDQPDIFDTSNYKAFIALQLQQLFEDPNYISVLKKKETTVELVNNELSVFMWIRSSSPQGTSEGGWLDVSPFIESCTTNVTKQGGSFNISFLPVEAAYTPENGWQPKSSKSYSSNGVDQDILITSHVTKYKEDKDPDKSAFKRPVFFFKDCIQQNDVVYIRFERLNNETKAQLIQANQLSAQDVPGLVYDLIGLVDTTSIVTDENSVRINVSGRDLIKPLIEDNSFFSAEYLAAQGGTGVSFFNNDGVLARRNRVELVLQSVITAIYSNNPIDIVMKFIFNKFSNLGCVPDDVFVGYGSNQRSKKYSMTSSSQDPAIKEIIKADDIFLKEDVRGIWRVMNLIFDPQIQQRRLADSSLTPESGSILNSINKLCQQPFVEFYADTYGDKFYLMVRKPPFDKQGVLGLVYGEVVNQNTDELKELEPKTTINDVNRGFKFEEQNTDVDLEQIVVTGKRQSLVIDIKDEVVESESLTYENTAYSWYSMYPQGLVPDFKKAALIIPIVSFDEYGEVWGSRQLTVPNNYLPIEIYNQDKTFDSANTNLLTQIFHDMKFIVESNCHLPFTRKGSITILGDRRIKRGMYIRYKPTGEIFYVDSVSNTRLVSGRENRRLTTIGVTRGMVEKYIKGVEVKFEDGSKDNVSYFNLIKMEIPKNAADNSFLKDWKVNKNVFNFFLTRQQWK
jgi:hypothetical protein